MVMMVTRSVAKVEVVPLLLSFPRMVLVGASLLLSIRVFTFCEKEKKINNAGSKVVKTRNVRDGKLVIAHGDKDKDPAMRLPSLVGLFYLKRYFGTFVLWLRST